MKFSSCIVRFGGRSLSTLGLLAGLVGFGVVNPATAQETETVDVSKPVPSTSIEDLRKGSLLLPERTIEDLKNEWARATDLIGRGKTRSALSPLKKILKTWPEDSTAPLAQRLIAEIELSRGKYQRSFDAYQELIDSYVGQFPYEEVLNEQLKIAIFQENRVQTSFFGLVKYTTPEDAIPQLRKILSNAPRWKLAPEIQFNIARIYHEKGKFRQAIAEYERVVQLYPGSPLAERASFNRAKCYLQISEKTPTDARAIENAWAAITLYLESYPGTPHIEKAMVQQRVLRNRMAKNHYDQARFYDVRARKPEIALIAYESLVNQFPNSEWTEKAKLRIEEIKQTNANTES